MIRIIFAVAVLASLAFGLQPANAKAPWCAVTSGGEGAMHWDCQYRSIEECRPNVLQSWLVQSEPVLRSCAHRA